MTLKRSYQLFFVLIFVFSLSSCSDNKVNLTALDNNAVILAYGDSLTFGFGANSQTESYPAVLSQLTGLQVVNAGLSGEISRHGLARLADVLKVVKPNLVILCHGGNDIIRRLSKDELKNNLKQMIVLIKRSGADVLLVGVPNFTLMLNVPELYSELAIEHDLPIELTLLSELERNPKMKSDQIHPNAQGYKLMAERLLTLLQDSGAI